MQCAVALGGPQFWIQIGQAQWVCAAGAVVGGGRIQQCRQSRCTHHVCQSQTRSTAHAVTHARTLQIQRSTGQHTQCQGPRQQRHAVRALAQ